MRATRLVVAFGCLFAFLATTATITTKNRRYNNHIKESCFCRFVAELYGTKRCALTSFIKIKTQRKEPSETLHLFLFVVVAAAAAASAVCVILVLACFVRSPLHIVFHLPEEYFNHFVWHYFSLLSLTLSTLISKFNQFELHCYG